MVTNMEAAAADDMARAMKGLPYPKICKPEARPLEDLMCEMILNLHAAGLPTTEQDLLREFSQPEIDAHFEKAKDMATTAIRILAERGQTHLVVRVPAGQEPV